MAVTAGRIRRIRPFAAKVYWDCLFPSSRSGPIGSADKENQPTGEEIKKLLFGSKITGIAIGSGQQWWADRRQNGETTMRGSGPIPADTGMSRIEGDLLCIQFQKIFWGLEYCFTVFKNPRGTYEGKDEYLNVTDFGFSPWSKAR